jgi:hypothetical protein
MALPSREDFARLEQTIATKLDRLIQLAEAGALAPAGGDTNEAANR